MVAHEDKSHKQYGQWHRGPHGLKKRKCRSMRKCRSKRGRLIALENWGQLSCCAPIYPDRSGNAARFDAVSLPGILSEH